MLAFGQAEDKQMSSDIINPEIWEKHKSAALDFLARASDCMLKSLQSTDKCDARNYLSKAEAEYAAMQALLKDGLGNSAEAAHIAEGYVRSGSPVRAVEYLLNRPGIKSESGLLRLLADTLYLLGDYKSAALTYRLWISTGCGGHNSAAWPKNLVIFVEKGKECSQLPSFLRGRLELLKEAEGEPSNLPEENDPPSIDNWK